MAAWRKCRIAVAGVRGNKWKYACEKRLMTDVSNIVPAGAAGAETGWRALLAAGANDFGGVSPLTKDYVNPEKPWPHVSALAAATAACGMHLVPRFALSPAVSLLHSLCCTLGRVISLHPQSCRFKHCGLPLMALQRTLCDSAMQPMQMLRAG